MRPRSGKASKGTRTKAKQHKHRERNHRERKEFLKQLRQIVQQQGSRNLIYVDECGFDNRVYQDYGYAKRGKKIYGSRTGKQTPRENLIAARRGRELLSPMLIQGSVNGVGSEKWLEQWLMVGLQQNSTLILDKGLARMCAPIHRKNGITEIVEAKGHQVLFLPRYSSDFNSIEHNFAAIKKRRKYDPEGTSVAQIVKNYSEKDIFSILI